MIQAFRDSVATFGPNVVAAIVILVIGWWISRLLASVVRRALTRSEIDATLVSFASHLVYVTALVLVVIAALGRLGINTASFAAVLAATGLAIGFALQGSLANFAAGVMLIFFRPIRVGDFVEVAGVAGAVEEVQLFATVLKTPDNKRVIVNNSSVTGGSIINYSFNPTRRIDMIFGIGYREDVKKAKAIVEDILKQDDRILEDPAPVVAVGSLGDSSVNLIVRPWVKTSDYWGVHNDLLERVKLAFDAAGIEIPFPQRDVHVHSAA